MSASSGPVARVARRARGLDRAIGILLLIALGLLIAGLLVPAVEVGVFLFPDTYSILEGVLALFAQGNPVLGAILLLFSVGFPAAKILFAMFVWWLTAPTQVWSRKAIGILADLSKWSMLDVFVVAVMILALEGSLLTTADIHTGLFLFAGSVVVSTFATRRLSLVLDRAASEPADALATSLRTTDAP